MTEPGTRVGAILSADAGTDTVNLLGYGTYVGHEPPVTAAGWVAEALVEGGQANPKILLDSGKVVWGCECWWGPEEAVRRKVAAYGNVVEVDIDEVRERHLGGS